MIIEYYQPIFSTFGTRPLIQTELGSASPDFDGVWFSVSHTERQN